MINSNYSLCNWALKIKTEKLLGFHHTHDLVLNIEHDLFRNIGVYIRWRSIITKDYKQIKQIFCVSDLLCKHYWHTTRLGVNILANAGDMPLSYYCTTLQLKHQFLGYSGSFIVIAVKKLLIFCNYVFLFLQSLNSAAMVWDYIPLCSWIFKHLISTSHK